MNLTIPDHYCYFMHAGLVIRLSPFGTKKIIVSPCLTESVKIEVDNFTNLFKHQALVELRENNRISKSLTTKCQDCFNQEKLGLNSKHKSSSNNYIDDKLIYNLSGPGFITFQISWLCNLACIVCGPHSSTKWRAEEGISGNVGISEQELRSVIQTLDLSNLHTVHIFGGEPMLNSVNRIILEELEPYAHNITVWYDTNATAIPDANTVRLWEKFKMIRLKFSIDAADNAFEYLRWPGRWEQVTHTVTWLKENLPPNHLFSLRPNFGMLNMHCAEKLIKWHEQEFSTNRMGDPTDLEYASTFGTFAAKNMNQPMIDELRNRYHNNSKFMFLLQLDAASNANERMLAAKNKLLQLDSKRHNSYRDSLPHLAKYFDQL